MNPSNTFTYFLIPKRWYVGSTCPISSSVIIQIYNFNKQ